MFIGKRTMYRRWILMLVALSIAACGPTFDRTDDISSEPAPTVTVPVCQPSPIQESPNSFPEIQATMHSEGEVWALLFFDEAQANEELKIVWRVTGGGKEVNVEAQNEEGIIIQPIWGPEFHPESTWNRPGTEWGTGFNFPKPGCWTITVTLGETTGEISLDVLDP